MAPMAARTQRTERRTEALSKERIVAAAIEILDTQGEAALTFRALTTRLATGSGAIYWHVANKDDLLAATTNAVVDRVMTDVAADRTGDRTAERDPRDAIRAVAVGVFDAIDAHPWVGAQLFREPTQTAMLRIFESIGQQLQTLGVPVDAQFDAASALVNYVLGVAGQNAANARLHADGRDRSTFLAGVADRWAQLDPAEYPFVRQVADQLREHDDRDQFLAGVDLVLAGMTVAR